MLLQLVYLVFAMWAKEYVETPMGKKHKFYINTPFNFFLYALIP